MFRLIGIMAAVLALASLAGASTATASGGGKEVIRQGSCSGRADWKLKAKLDDGRIEVEFEVDQNRVGRRWRVVIRQNGVKRFSGIRTTQPPSGSFEVRRFLDNKPGSDRIVGRARALANGQTCRGALTI
jgi:hypothetical protein